MLVVEYKDPLLVDEASRFEGPDAKAREFISERLRAYPFLEAIERSPERVDLVPTPEDPVLAVSIGVTVVATAYAIWSHLRGPEAITTDLEPDVDDTSGDNRLGSRLNRMRWRARVPDIFGTVRRVPDLVAVPYKTFENNVHVETALMCIGRGQYEVSELREGDTPLESLPEHGAAVYGPGTWPGQGTPQLVVGTPPSDPPRCVYTIEVPQGELEPENSTFLAGLNDVRVVDPDVFETNNPDYEMAELFPVGSTFEAVQAFLNVPGAGLISFEGTWTVVDADSDFVQIDEEFDDPDLAAAGASDYGNALLERIDDPWTDWIFSGGLGDQLITSFVAPTNLIRIRGDDSARLSLTVQVEVQMRPSDSNGSPTGPDESYVFNLVGDPSVVGRLGFTYFISPTAGLSHYFVRARRVTRRLNLAGIQSDGVEWADTYLVSDIDGPFEGVTLVHSRAAATVDSRAETLKLSALVTRQLESWTGSSFIGPLTSTKSGARAAASLCLDSRIGRLSSSEVDLESLFASETTLLTYFGYPESVEFTHVFDRDGVGFEDMLLTVLRAAFMSVERVGPRLVFSPAIPRLASLLLSNRVMLPGSQTYDFRFGQESGSFDGVELRYLTEDGEPDEALVPPGDPARPRKVETAGVRNRRQALTHAWREWNRLRFVRETAQVSVTDEGRLARAGDTVLMVDAVRPGTTVGELTGLTGTLVTVKRRLLNQPSPGVLDLQLSDGSVDTIDVVGYPSDTTIELSREPVGPINVAEGSYSRGAFSLRQSSVDPVARRYEVLGSKPRGDSWTLELLQSTFMRTSVDQVLLWLPLTEAVDWSPQELFVEDVPGSYPIDPARGSRVRFSPGGSLSVTGLTMGATNWTVAFWVRSGASGTAFVLSAPTYRITLGAYPELVRLSVLGDGSTEVLLGPTGSWRHVIVTVSPTGTSNLYVDGVSYGGHVSNLTGSFSPLMCAVSGYMSDFRIWQTELSKEDIATLVAATQAPVVI